MKKIMSISLAIVLLSFHSSEQKNLFSFKLNSLEGKPFDLSKLKGKKVLIVNTASECGFTPQYKDLEELYKKYKSKNFEILGFPCNDFGGQEPGTAQEIQGFCIKNYGVTFQMMEKVSIKGDRPHPLYSWLTKKSENGVLDSDVKWNFNKFLIDEKGNVVKHLGSMKNPMSEEITNWIEGK